MWKKRLFYTCLTFITLTVLAAILGTARYFIRNAVLKKAASEISKTYFEGETPKLDLKKRTVVFSAAKSEILRRYALHGVVTFSFPVRFFELPWNLNNASIAVDGVSWDLNLKEKTLNKHPLSEFTEKLTFNENLSNRKAPDLITYGTLNLTNPEGRTRKLAMRSIFKRNKDYRLLGVYAGDMKVNFLFNEKTKKLIGQYQAQQSDFEFFRLSFGLPELFTMHGVGTLAGQFQYDAEKKQLEYIRGGAEFGMGGSIQGSIFSLYGSRRGMINWEYLNAQNWQIELRNAMSGRPFRTKLHYLVLSQNTMEQNSVSFDGEIEFNPATFRDSFGLEFDRRTAALRHRLVGKWNMNDKSWELSRLDAGRRIPQVKLKWNDFAVAFQNRSFKLSGAGAQADHFAFRYELEMANADWKDKNNNAVITSSAKLEGDCILSLSDDTLKPVATGKISCDVADGAFDNTRFLLKNVHLHFSPDAGGKTKYQFSTGDFSVGMPDLQNGVRIDIPRLEGESSMAELKIAAPSFNIKYRDTVNLSSAGAWSLKRLPSSNKIQFKTSALRGYIGKEKFKSERILAEFEEKAMQWQCDYFMYNLKVGNNIFSADELQGAVSGDSVNAGVFSYQGIKIKPVNWKYNSKLLRCSSPSSVFDIEFDNSKKWKKWNCNAGQFSMTYGGRNYIVPGLVCNEENRGSYSDGSFYGHGTPYKVKFSYTRPEKSKNITIKNGSIDGNYEFFRGLAGDVKIFEKNRLFAASLQFEELKMQDSSWRHGALGMEMNNQSGFELVSFNGISSTDTSVVKFIGRKQNGTTEFEVRNLPAKYVENTLNAAEGTLSGLFDGKVTMPRKEFFNPFKIQTFYLKNNQVMRLRLGAFDKYAQKGNSIEDMFASDALKDFFAKSLTLDYHKVGQYKVLDVKALGKATDLLPYEYDVKEKKLKKSDVALFNSEVEVIMKYMMK